MDKVNESILSETILEDMKENRIDNMTYLEGMEVLDSDVEKTVVEAMNAYDYDSYTAADVRRAIYKDNRTPEDLHRFILQITVRIIVFTVVLIAIIKSVVRNLMPRELNVKWLKLQNPVCRKF